MNKILKISLIGCSILILIPIVILLVLVLLQFNLKADLPQYSKSISESKRRGVFIKQYKHSSKKNKIEIEEIWLERQWISTLFLNGTDTTKIDGYTLIIRPSMEKNEDYNKFAVIGLNSNSLGWSSIGDRLFIVKNYFTYPEIDGIQFRVRENRDPLDTNNSPLRIYDTIYIKPY